jgi:putative hydroxymethylpyrimidine transport system substrate-binding protein
MTVLLDWFPNPDHVGLYMAKSDGAYTKQGLNVTLQAPSGTSDAAKLVSTEKVDVAISYEPDTILARANNMNVTAVASVVPTALNSVIIKGDGTIGGLAGKKVGNPGTASSETTLTYILKSKGVNHQSVTNVNLSQGLVQPLIVGKVDAVIGAYSNIEGVQLSAAGKYSILPINELGVPNYDELVVIANPDRLKSDSAYKKRVQRFIVALQDGTQAAIENPNGAYDAISKVTEGYNKDQLRQMVEKTVPLLRNPKGLGQMDATQWDSYATWMYDNGLLSSQIKGSSAMTTELITTNR